MSGLAQCQLTDCLMLMAGSSGQSIWLGQVMCLARTLQIHASSIIHFIGDKLLNPLAVGTGRGYVGGLRVLAGVLKNPPCQLLHTPVGVPPLVELPMQGLQLQ